MRCRLTPLALLLLLVPAAGARYIRPDLEMIPVERLVKNLTDLAEKEPKNAKWRFNLARVHGMAYAKNTDTVTIWKGKLDSGAWFGHTPALVPFAKDVVKRAKTSDKARKHLDQAIAERQRMLADATAAAEAAQAKADALAKDAEAAARKIDSALQAAGVKAGKLAADAEAQASQAREDAKAAAATRADGACRSN